MSDSPIFAGLEPHKWKVCVPRLGGFGTVTRNTGRWTHRLENLCSSADGTAERKSNERSAAAE